MARASFTVNPAGIRALTAGRNSPVGKMMAGFAGLSTRACRDVARERLSGQSSGRYIRSIQSTTEGSPRGVRMVTRAISYAGAPDRATRPHTIRPRRRGGVLRFKVGSKVVYARSVQHPGTEAKHILRDGVKRAARQLTRGQR